MGPNDPKVLDALRLCGAADVFHNDGDPPSIAIRWTKGGRWTDKWITESGASHDEAGRRAAVTFSSRLRERAAAFASWADRIDAALAPPKSRQGEKPPGEQLDDALASLRRLHSRACGLAHALRVRHDEQLREIELEAWEAYVLGEAP